MTDQRLEREIAHGKFLLEHGAAMVWNWGTPAGRLRLERRCRMLTEHLRPDLDVLEPGCGTGLFTREFLKTGARFTAIDISPDLLEAARQYAKDHPDFRFHHISTDEVYGDLDLDDSLFTEETPYDPSSPYSASKASSDHLVRAWQRTFGLKALITNCSNNYGPYHFPEKLIPLVILNALEGKPLPIYGKGDQIRDWLYVEDHARALCTVCLTGIPGQTYNIGGHNEKQNIEVVKTICAILDELKPRNDGHKYSEQITFVADRPGHDMRYAIDAGKIERELGWRPAETFETGLRKTVQWYLDNKWWWEPLREKYQRERLGLKK